MSASSHALFCYGTLCVADIMRAVCAYQRAGESTTLNGYQCVALHGLRFPAVIPEPDAITNGILYRALNSHQLHRIDQYEDDMYRRVRVHVFTAALGNVEAWTYVLHPRYYRLIKKQPWSLAEFMARHQAAYQHQHGW